MHFGKPILQRLKSNSALKGFLTLLGGSLIAQVIPFAISPLLSRLFAPEYFGLLAEFTSVAGVFAALSTLQFDSAIMLPRRNEEALKLVGLTIYIVLVMSLFSFAILILLRGFGFSLFSLELSSVSFLLIPVYVLVSGIFLVFSAWFLRLKKFKILSLRQIGSSFTMASSKTVFGFVGLLDMGLIYGTILGQLASLIVYIYSFSKDFAFSRVTSSFSVLKRLFIRYRDYAKFTTWQGFFDGLSFAAVIWLLNKNLGLELVGLYSFTIAIIQRPVTIVATEISRVYFQKIIELKHQRKPLRKYSMNLFFVMLIASSILFLPLIFFGEKLFFYVFGNRWGLAGVLSASFIPLLITQFCITPFTRIPEIFSKQKVFFQLALGQSVLIPFIYLVCFHFEFESFFKLVLLVSSVIALYRLLLFGWFLAELDAHDKTLIIKKL